jgi:hypothetical protein
MSWTATYTEEGAELRFVGFVTGAEILAAKADFFARCSGNAARFVLCDFSSAESVDISSEDIQRIVDQDKAAMADHPRVLEAVVASKSLVYGLARMWQMRVDEARPHTGVLRTRDEALQWFRAHGVSLPFVATDSDRADSNQDLAPGEGAL